MTTRLLPSRVWLALALAASVAAACVPAKTVKKGDQTPPSPKEETSVDISTAPAMEVGEADIRGSEFAADEGLEPIRFDYDAYALPEDARATLKKNADYLGQHRDLDVLVAGHCDERGTTEYNLALGQRRAKEVRDYYLRLGVAAKSVATISYGKERPACQERNEACWKQNRRAETLIRSRTAATAPAETANPKAPQ